MELRLHEAVIIIHCEKGVLILRYIYKNYFYNAPY